MMILHKFNIPHKIRVTINFMMSRWAISLSSATNSIKSATIRSAIRSLNSATINTAINNRINNLPISNMINDPLISNIISSTIIKIINQIISKLNNIFMIRSIISKRINNLLINGRICSCIAVSSRRSAANSRRSSICSKMAVAAKHWSRRKRHHREEVRTWEVERVLL